MGSRRRFWLNQGSQFNVSHSRSSTVFQGPCLCGPVQPCANRLLFWPRHYLNYPHIADRGLDTGLTETLVVADGQVLRAAVAVMNQSVRSPLSRVQRPLQRIQNKVRQQCWLTRQPTMKRE